MEAEHSETIVDKAVAYVKDMLGMSAGDRISGRSGKSRVHRYRA